jgi:hypothetical protein
MDSIEIWISDAGETVSQFLLWETVDVDYWLQKQEYEIWGLKPDTRYWIMIRDADSTNPSIKGAFSTPIEIKTAIDDYVYAYDGVFKIYISEYGITYDSYSLEITKTLNTALPSYTFENLKPDTRYWVIVRETYPPNGDIKGAFSEALEINTTLTDEPGRQLLISKNNVDFYSHSSIIVDDGGDVLIPLYSDTTYYVKLKGIITPEESNTIIFTTQQGQGLADNRDVYEDDFIISGMLFRNRVGNENNTANTISFSFDGSHFSKKRKYCTEVE